MFDDRLNLLLVSRRDIGQEPNGLLKETKITILDCKAIISSVQAVKSIRASISHSKRELKIVKKPRATLIETRDQGRRCLRGNILNEIGKANTGHSLGGPSGFNHRLPRERSSQLHFIFDQRRERHLGLLYRSTGCSRVTFRAPASSFTTLTSLHTFQITLLP